MAYTSPCILGENVACVNQRTFSCAVPSPKDPYTQPSPTKKSRWKQDTAGFHLETKISLYSITKGVKDHLPSFLNTAENKFFSSVVVLLILVLQLHKIPLHSYIHSLSFTLSCLWQGSFHCNCLFVFKTPPLKCNNLVARVMILGKMGGKGAH